jgi:adenylate cyclase
MNLSGLRPYRTINNYIRLITVGANSIGALLTVTYSTFIDPVPKGASAVSSSSFMDLLPVILGTTLLMVVGNLMSRFAERYHPKWYERIRAGESPADMPDVARREVLNYPAFSALTSLTMWTLAAVFFGYFPDGGLEGFVRIVGVGGVLTTALVYFGIDALWRPIVPVFIPDGQVSHTKAFRIPVFGRMMFVFVLAGLYPTVLLAISTFFHARSIIDAPNPQVVLNNMILAMVFVLVTSLTVGVALTFLIAHSVVSPLNSLQNEMSRVKQNDLNAHVRVLANDELGYVSERFNEMVDGLRHGELLRNLLNLYVSPEVAREALEHGTHLGGQLIECTVLFSDIRGFTALTEELPANELITLLNQYMSQMVDVIVANGGMVNKFGGDSLLAVFGTPLNPSADHAGKAINAAREMHQALKNFNSQQLVSGSVELHFGIGIATGDVVAGNIGGAERIEYTVIGDTVNLASRLQDLTKEIGQEILVHESTYAAATKTQKVAATRMPPAVVRGKSETVNVYALVF